MTTHSPALIVVESPTKAKTLGQFLGKQYEVVACMGHVRALPSKSGSVDISRDFEPRYAVLPQSKKHLEKIEKALRHCGTVYLATDMDREGEAISWHLTVSLGWAMGRRPPGKASRLMSKESYSTKSPGRPSRKPSRIPGHFHPAGGRAAGPGGA